MRYCHLIATTRRRKNIIKSLKKGNGSVIAEINEIEEMATKIYLELYTSQGVSNMQKVLGFVPDKVAVAMNTSLNVAYREEVKNALFQLFPSKVLGHGRSPAHFLCNDEVVKEVLHIVEGVDSAEYINNTYLVLIPKVKSPTSLPHFCTLA